MTLPAERRRAVRDTRDFLRSLCSPKETPRVPRSVRDRAWHLLRHYPTDFDMANVRLTFGAEDEK
jgi:hypothetical protein